LRLRIKRDELRAVERSQAQATINSEAEGEREMAEWKKKIGAINLIVGDLERSKAFYRDVFGLPLQHEDEETAMFRFGDTYVFLQRGAAHQDVPSDDALTLGQKGVGQFVMFVEDVDEVGAELGEHNVEVISDPADRDWGMRTLTFADPGGYTWEITQEVPDAPNAA
jgi:catechol 2,3-dioxygenase-like lactoylglutathione lyase family enzyme